MTPAAYLRKLLENGYPSADWDKDVVCTPIANKFTSNRPFRPEGERPAPRYQGLHDVLRDACPDAWGQALLRREHNLPEGTDMARYLILAGNADRWGALAVGTRPAPSVALSSPKLSQLPALVEELAA